jgi:hypothetical protein
MGGRTCRAAGFLLLVAVAFASLASAEEYRWRRDVAAVNLNNHPLDDEFPEERFKDSIKTRKVSETSFTIRARDQDRQHVNYDVTLTASFKAPPEFIESEGRIPLRATISGNGTAPFGRPGMIFQYNTRGGTLEGESTLRGSFIEGILRTGSIDPVLIAPKATQDGEFRVYAVLWNEPACNVLWIYRAEPVAAGGPEAPAPAADGPPAEWGDFVGHLYACTPGGVWIIRGGERIPAQRWMRLYRNDRIVTEDGLARVGLFRGDVLAGLASSVKTTYHDVYGNIVHWKEYPVPPLSEMADLFDSLPPGMQAEYIDALTYTFSLGRNSELSVDEDVRGSVYVANLQQRPWWQPPRSRGNVQAGSITARTLVAKRTEGGWAYVDETSTFITALRTFFSDEPDRVPYRDSTIVHRPWLQPATPRQREGLENWLRRNGQGVPGSRPQSGIAIRPTGTEYFIEADPDTQRFFVGVREGSVECFDLRSGKVVTVGANEKIDITRGRGGGVQPMSTDEWQTMVSRTALPPEAEPAAEHVWDLPDLQADVLSVRTFESGLEGIPFERRQYRDQYSAADTRFVCWELRLAFASPQRRIDFGIEAVYRTAAGREVGRATHDAFLEPEWTEPSVHDRGWKPDAWTPGGYRVDLYVGGVLVGCASFEITAPGSAGTAREEPRPATGVIPAIQARVRGVKLYEGGDQGPLYGDRAYAEAFAARDTRFVYWELDLEHPNTQRRLDFEVRAVWYRPDGQVWAERTKATHLEPAWRTSQHTHGLGWPERGKWEPGRYRVVLSVDGEEVAERTFEITGPGEGGSGERAFPPTLGVVAPIQARATDLKFYESGVEPPPMDQRVFRERFPSVGPEYIGWCLFLEHPAPDRRIDFTIDAVYRQPGGHVLNKQAVATHIPAGFASTYHGSGWGLGRGGRYGLGVYTVELSVNGEVIATGNFEIEP